MTLPMDGPVPASDAERAAKIALDEAWRAWRDHPDNLYRVTGAGPGWADYSAAYDRWVDEVRASLRATARDA